MITAQKMKFSIKDFFSKCDQIHSFFMQWIVSFQIRIDLAIPDKNSETLNTEKNSEINKNKHDWVNDRRH